MPNLGVFSKAVPLLKAKSYLAVSIGDMYNQVRYHFLSSDLARMLEDIGLTLKTNIVWYDVSKSLHEPSEHTGFKEGRGLKPLPSVYSRLD